MTAKSDKKKGLKCTAANEQFCQNESVSRPKVCENSTLAKPPPRNTQYNPKSEIKNRSILLI
jgi:hypothetical protein